MELSTGQRPYSLFLRSYEMSIYSTITLAELEDIRHSESERVEVIWSDDRLTSRKAAKLLKRIERRVRRTLWEKANPCPRWDNAHRVSRWVDLVVGENATSINPRGERWVTDVVYQWLEDALDAHNDCQYKGKRRPIAQLDFIGQEGVLRHALQNPKDWEETARLGREQLMRRYINRKRNQGLCSYVHERLLIPSI
jgi:hypothetical protein